MADKGESREDFTVRMQQSGKWRTVRDYVNRTITKLRSDAGCEDPVGEAWKLAMAKWPPEPKSVRGSKESLPAAAGGSEGGRFSKGKTPSGAEAPPLSEEAAERFDQLRLANPGRPLSTVEEDILWAYQNLDRPDALDVDAPSEGAWSMLHYARAYRQGFLEKMVPGAMKVVSARTAPGGEDAVRPLSETDKKATSAVRAMLRTAIAESQKITLDDRGELTGPYVG